MDLCCLSVDFAVLYSNADLFLAYNEFGAMRLDDLQSTLQLKLIV